MHRCIFMQGIPLSGKSTWCKNNYLYAATEWIIISRDDIREQINGKGKKMYDSRKEKEVTKIFNKMLINSTVAGINLLIDNTNLNPRYIDDIVKLLPDTYTVEFVRLEIPLWKAYYRNVIRYWKTGKWIPFQVIRKFKKQLDEFKWERKKEDKNG